MTSCHPGADHLTRGCVEAQALDANGHMNVAAYTAVFDRAMEAWLKRHGLAVEPHAADPGGVFVLESHVRYQRELRADEEYAVSGQLIAFDEKRAHLFLRMRNLSRDLQAATCELLLIHVDLTSRHAAPWPAEVRRRLERALNMDERQGRPVELGARIAIERPRFDPARLFVERDTQAKG